MACHAKDENAPSSHGRARDEDEAHGLYVRGGRREPGAGGTLPPAFRASERPIAIACLRLRTRVPERRRGGRVEARVVLRHIACFALSNEARVASCETGRRRPVSRPPQTRPPL